jgi:hypothetical protein
LQDQGRGDLVDKPLVRLALMTGLVEDLVCLVRREALLPEVDGQLGQLFQLGSEGMDLQGLGSYLAFRTEGISDHNAGYFIAPAEASEGTEVFARATSALEGEHRLRRQRRRCASTQHRVRGSEVGWAGRASGFQVQLKSRWACSLISSRTIRIRKVENPIGLTARPIAEVF